MKHIKKQCLALIIALSMQPIFMARAQAQWPSWSQVGIYAAGAGTVPAGYGLYQLYKKITYKKPVQAPSFFQELITDLPGGRMLLKGATSVWQRVKKHPYIAAACAVGLFGLLANRSQVDEQWAQELYGRLIRLRHHEFASQGKSRHEKQTALDTACCWIMEYAKKSRDQELLQMIEKFLNYYCKPTVDLNTEEGFNEYERNLDSMLKVIGQKIGEIVG
ncbi:MAG: hypothetical protein WD068_02815 [Candidatus Babeliales bacterium]